MALLDGRRPLTPLHTIALPLQWCCTFRALLGCSLHQRALVSACCACPGYGGPFSRTPSLRRLVRSGLVYDPTEEQQEALLRHASFLRLLVLVAALRTSPQHHTSASIVHGAPSR